VAKNEGSRKEQEQGQELGSNRWVTMEFDSNVGWHLCVVVRIFVFLTKSLFFGLLTGSVTIWLQVSQLSRAEPSMTGKSLAARTSFRVSFDTKSFIDEESRVTVDVVWVLTQLFFCFQTSRP
jgi:hypothetical protein